jgi:hypothetical protein
MGLPQFTERNYNIWQVDVSASARTRGIAPAAKSPENHQCAEKDRVCGAGWFRASPAAPWPRWPWANFKDRLQPEEKKPASYAVHYAFGTTVGGLYGIAAELKPAVATAAGAPFGAAVWLGAHEIAVPALKLGKPPTREPLPLQAVEFASHVVYGVTADAVRRLVHRCF